MALKVVAIGCGAFSHMMHGPSYAKYAALRSGTALAACCDVDEAKAAGFQAAFGFQRAYSDYREMLARERPDAVILHASIGVSAAIAVDILERGVPLLMEKPPGETREQTLAIVAAAARGGASAKVALNRRYMPLMRKLKELLRGPSDEDDPAAIRHIQMEMIRYRRKYDFSTTAIHAIDAVRFLAGCDYERIRFRYRLLPEDGPNVANVLMDCEMTSGATAQLTICPTAGATIERAAVHLKDQSFYVRLPVGDGVDEAGELLRLFDKQGVETYAGVDFPDSREPFESNGFYADIAAFLDGVRHGRPAGVDVRDALQSVEVAECMRLRLPEYVRRREEAHESAGA